VMRTQPHLLWIVSFGEAPTSSSVSPDENVPVALFHLLSI
jgi:hypothetical protein